MVVLGWDPERQPHDVLSASHREVLRFRDHAVRLRRKKRRPGVTCGEFGKFKCFYSGVLVQSKTYTLVEST